mgnify:CR=1 FL=1
MSVIADAVIHAYNFAPSNFAHERYSKRFALGTYSHHKLWSPDDPRYVLPESQFLVDFDEEDVAAAVFAESPIDVAAYHATPIFDFFRDGLVSMEKGARLKECYPRRVLFYGAVPLVERKEAMAILEEQVRTYRVDGIKFYPALYVDGRTIPTPIDSEDIALPVIERAAALGITNFAVHKSIPLGPTTTDPYRMDDVVVPAARVGLTIAALFCFIDRKMGPPQWSDLGMFLQTFMLLAQEAGLDTCAQEWWSATPSTAAIFFSTTTPFSFSRKALAGAAKRGSTATSWKRLDAASFVLRFKRKVRSCPLPWSAQNTIIVFSIRPRASMNANRRPSSSSICLTRPM